MMRKSRKQRENWKMPKRRTLATQTNLLRTLRSSNISMMGGASHQDIQGLLSTTSTQDHSDTQSHHQDTQISPLCSSLLPVLTLHLLTIFHPLTSLSTPLLLHLSSILRSPLLSGCQTLPPFLTFPHLLPLPLLLLLHLSDNLHKLSAVSCLWL